MKKILLFAITLITLLACQKEEEIALADDSKYLVFNESLENKPVATENGYYFVSMKDSVLKLIHLDATGNYNTLLNITEAYLSGIEYDSVLNITVSERTSGNVILSYTYNSSVNDLLVTMVQAVEVDLNGTIISELNQAIPSYNNNNYSYLATIKDDNNWLVLSSFSEIEMQNSNSQQLSLQFTKYTTSGTETTSESNFEVLNELSVVETYTLSNKIVVVLSESQSNLPPEQTSTTSTYTLLTVNPDGTSSQLTVQDNILEIELIEQNDDELIVIGVESKTANETILKVTAYENNLETWGNELSFSSSFSPTCIEMASEEFVLGGLNGDTREFSWNNIYEQVSTNISMYAYNYDGQLNWSITEDYEFQTILVGLNQSEEGYACLLAKRSYDTYNNIALLETNFEGQLN